MKEVGIIDAGNRFSEIARQVKETGNPVRVMNLGEEIVDIMPVAKVSSRQRSRENAFAELARLRRTLTPTTIEQIRADIIEGRR